MERGGGDEEEESNLESPLVGQKRQEGWCRFGEEAKRQIWLAGPLIGVSVLQYSLQVIGIMFVGHLGNLPLSGASLASSFANVSGFSVLVGYLIHLPH